MTSKIKYWAPFAGPLLAVILYASSIGFDFVLDDFGVATENTIVAKGVSGIGEVFSTPYRSGYWVSDDNLYRPLSLALFALESQLTNGAPWLMHLINVLLFAASCGMVYRLASQLSFKNQWVPLAASLLFAAHALHVEVVANIKSRDELLTLFFILLGLLTLFRYLQRPTASRWVGLLLIALATFFSKESGVLFLGFVPLILWYKKAPLKTAAIGMSAFALPAALYFMARFQVMGGWGTETPDVLENFLVQVPEGFSESATQWKIMGLYACKLIWPFQLSHDYGLAHLEYNHWGQWQPWAGLLTWLLPFGLGVYHFFTKRSPAALLVLLLCTSMVLAANLLLLTGTAIADRLAYTPSLWFILLLCWWLFSKVHNAKVVGGAVGLVLACWIGLTLHRIPAWENNLTLLTTDVETTPQAARIHYRLGVHYNLNMVPQTKDPTARQQLTDQAIVEFREAVRLHPQYADAMGQLGQLLARNGQMEEGYQLMETALTIKPNHFLLQHNMGVYYMVQRNLPAAISYLQTAQQLNPNYALTPFALSQCYQAGGQSVLALEAINAALSLAPEEARFHALAGKVNQALGNNQAANFHFNEANRLTPVK